MGKGESAVTGEESRERERDRSLLKGEEREAGESKERECKAEGPTSQSSPTVTKREEMSSLPMG